LGPDVKQEAAPVNWKIIDSAPQRSSISEVRRGYQFLPKEMLASFFSFYHEGMNSWSGIFRLELLALFSNWRMQILATT
jgi:hypothetical protein